MTIREMIDQDQYEIINEGSDLSRQITEPFCCDLLSVAMGNAPAGCAWCTVMSNMNTLAVASLTDAGCVILCMGANVDDNMKMKAASEGITLLRTEKGIFETALYIYKKLHEKDQL